jgi:outer membrane protein assembly factor BamB
VFGPLDASGLRPIPGLDSKYVVSDWTSDGASLFVTSSQNREKTAKVYRVNATTGKMDLWKELGQGLQTGLNSIGPPLFSADGRAYAYVYTQTQSQAYVVKGLK